MTELSSILNAQAARTPDLQVDLLAAMRPLIRYNFEKEFEKLPESTRRSLLVHHTGIMAGGSDKQCALAYPADVGIESIPAVMLTSRYLEILNPDFYNRYLNHGYFSKLKQECKGPFASLTDMNEENELYIHSSCPFIFLIDKRNLDNLPVPDKWENLADPIYKGKICFNATRYGPEPTLLLYLYSMFGYDGVKAVCSNVVTCLHGSVMLRNLGTLRNSGAAIYLAPAFFAFCARGNEKAEIVFPKDGIPFIPLYMTVKAGQEERCRSLIDILCGEKITSLLTFNGYPAFDAPNYDAWGEHPLTWFPEKALTSPNAHEILDNCRALFPDHRKDHKWNNERSKAK